MLKDILLNGVADTLKGLPENEIMRVFNEIEGEDGNKVYESADKAFEGMTLVDAVHMMERNMVNIDAPFFVQNQFCEVYSYESLNEFIDWDDMAYDILATMDFHGLKTVREFVAQVFQSAVLESGRC